MNRAKRGKAEPKRYSYRRRTGSASVESTLLGFVKPLCTALLACLGLFFIQPSKAEVIADPAAFAVNNQFNRIVPAIFTVTPNPASSNSVVVGPLTRPKVAGVGTSTGLVSATGPGGLATSRAEFITSAAGAGISVDTSGSFALAVTIRPTAVATTAVRDPAIFSNAGNVRFSLTYGWSDGFSVSAFTEGLDPASSWIATEAGSNIPGFEDFFYWALSLNGSDAAPLLAFKSNALLGLDDEAIRKDMLAHLTFDPATNRYTVGSAFAYASFDVTVPLEQSEVAFFWNTEGVAEVAVIPEPSTFALLGLVLFFISGRKGPRIRPRNRLAPAVLA
jgi:hypothetical protein